MPVFFDAAEMQAEGTPPGELRRIIQERYATRYYRAPERAGVSYMLSPVLRTYTNPDENEDVVTASVPHVMYFAPNVLGVSQRAAVTKQYKGMLAALCKAKEVWCLPSDNRND